LTEKNVNFDQKAAHVRCVSYRKRILEISQKVTALHVAPAFSCVEIVDLIYSDLMKVSVSSEDIGDYFLMSKGHGCMAQYAVLEDLGILSKEELNRYSTPEGILGAHPDRGNPGIIASTGSLGHGLGLAVGMAYAEKLKKTNSKIFALLSDGELQEGSSWEAAMMAANLALDNLIIFIDANDFGGMDRMSQNHLAFYPLREKFESFGWECAEANGHDGLIMKSAYLKRTQKKPFVSICSTIKGKGVSFMENIPMWHYRSPDKDEYLKAVSELEGSLE
jgi:transketolase